MNTLQQFALSLTLATVLSLALAGLATSSGGARPLAAAAVPTIVDAG